MKAFYQSIHYEALRERWVRRTPIGPNITFAAGAAHLRNTLSDHFETMTAERVGILHGEYMLLEDGMTLVDRQGLITLANVGLEDWWVGRGMAEICLRPDVVERIHALLGVWDRMPVVHRPPVLSDPYVSNYYHFSLELVPRLRFLAPLWQAGGGQVGVVMPRTCLEMSFQRDLLARTMTGMSCLPLTRPLRVCDPILAHDVVSHEGMFWLRRVSGVSAGAGARRIYIRRSGRGTRSAAGGGVSESPGFAALLKDFGFETLEFGDGEHGVATQVAMLEGAGLILAAHGAALTNLAYLQPQIAVIEILGSATARACFMQVAAGLGFTYHGIYGDSFDDQGNIVIDVGELHDALRDRIAPVIAPRRRNNTVPAACPPAANADMEVMAGE